MLCSAGLLSSLVHTRAGIPDAMLAIGALSVLTERLMSDASEAVRQSCAVTLGYLTYNRTAARHLFAACRNTPRLYDQIITSMGPAARLNPDFVTDFQSARKVGLPCMRYCYTHLSLSVTVFSRTLLRYVWIFGLGPLWNEPPVCRLSICL